MAKGKRKRRNAGVNSKKNMRKTDISDVEAGLEARANEERLFGGQIETVPDEALFVVDKKGDAPTRSKAKKMLYRDRFLLGNPNIKPVAGAPKRKVVEGKKQSHAEKRKIAAMAERLANQPAKKKRTAQGAGDLELLWADDKKPYNPKAFDYHNKGHGEIAPLTKQNDRILKPRLPRTTSKRKAVEVDHAGNSYNPSREAHQTRLQKALDIELEAQRQRDIAAAKLAAPKELLEKADTEDPLHGGADDSDDESSGDGEVHRNPPTVNKKMTRAERNRQARVKAEAEMLAKKAADKELRRQLERVKDISKEVDEDEKVSVARKAKRQAKKEKGMYEPQRIGRRLYKEGMGDLLLTEELPSSLRELPKTGHVLVDRYKSLQKRNMVETRVKVTRRRRYQLKVKEKGYRGGKSVSQERPANASVVPGVM